MRFDTIIIGGGLSGLTAGIELSRKGQKCLIVSSGQSALHFFSGSLELYDCDDPLKGISVLGQGHPYFKIGYDQLRAYISQVKPLFKEVGIDFMGENEQNHWRITPLGVLKRAWLTLDEYASVPSDGTMPWQKVVLLNIDGFLDFHASYIAAGLSHMGVECRVDGISMPELNYVRNNPTEMRATNIAKTLSRDLLGALASRINEHAEGVDAVLMPAVVGLSGNSEVVKLKELVNRPLHFLATLPPSVPGIRLQMMLKRHFQKLGGVYMLGDTVVGGEIVNGRLEYIMTKNHGQTRFEADNFIVSTGSFFSKGLVADISCVREPIFGLDVEYCDDRSQWYKKNMFDNQPYLSFGVSTDNSFHAQKDGIPVDNLFVAGSLLSGCNSIKEGSGAGVAVLTALHVASLIQSRTDY